METINKPTLYAAVVMVAVLAIFLVIANAPERDKELNYQVEIFGGLEKQSYLVKESGIDLEAMTITPIVFGEAIDIPTTASVMIRPK